MTPEQLSAQQAQHEELLAADAQRATLEQMRATTDTAELAVQAALHADSVARNVHQAGAAAVGASTSAAHTAAANAHQTGQVSAAFSDLAEPG